MNVIKTTSVQFQTISRLAYAAGLGVLAALLVVGPVSAQTTIGAGVGFMPKYEGAKNYRARPFPLVTHENGNFFIAPKAEMPAIGLQADLASNWKIGVFGGLQWGRKASDDHRLYGTDRIKRHGAAGVFTQANLGDVSLNATYYHALKKNYGGGLQLGASYGVWSEGPSSLRVGGVLSFVDDDAMSTNFGVKHHEAAASRGRLHHYDPSGGLKSYTLYGSYSHSFSNSWALNTTLGLKNLTGSARNSPLVERKASVYGSVGLGYSF